MKSRHALILLVTAVLLTGCHSSRKTMRGSRATRVTTTTQTGRGHEETVRVTEQPRGRAGHLLDVARGWIGTPYRYGGNDRKGIDCSGFTCAVFDIALGIKLPRSSREQAEFCKPLQRKALKAGDLVFFSARAGGERINHVAIYMGDNAIIHATTSRGVIISDLDEDYWKTHYRCAGRVAGANL